MNTQTNIQSGPSRSSSISVPDSVSHLKVFFTLLFMLQVAMSLATFIWAAVGLIKVNTLIASFSLLFLSLKIRREYAPVYLYTGFLIAAFLVSSLYVARTDWRLFTPVLFIISGFNIALILLRGYVYSWGGYAIFYALAGYFMLMIFSGVDGASAMKYCSFNGISMVMLVVCISLYIILETENKKFDIKPALLTLAISIWGIGRSGIVVGFVLFLGLLSIRLKHKPKYFIRVLVFLLIAFLGLRATDYSFFGNAIAHQEERGTVLTDHVRAGMWANYYNNLDIARVIFGVNVLEDPWETGEINEYNYHNSFINLHLQTGFMGLITMAIIVKALFVFYRTNRVFFFLLLALVLRASVDLFIFFGAFDFLPFFFIFYLLRERQRSKTAAPLRAAG